MECPPVASCGRHSTGHFEVKKDNYVSPRHVLLHPVKPQPPEGNIMTHTVTIKKTNKNFISTAITAFLPVITVHVIGWS